MSASLLSVENLAHRYGNDFVLRGVSFAVKRGEVVAVIGPSGAGKTTLFRCINQLTRPTAGHVRLHGGDVTAMRARQLRRAQREIAVIFQQFNLVQRRSAIENVVAGGLASIPLWRVLTGAYGATFWRDAGDALLRVGLAKQAHQRADQLSGGQQQRVAIARTLLQRPSLVLADEPVSSLDPAASQTVLTLLGSLAREHGIAVLCSLHQIELIDGFADRVIGLRDGEVAFDRRAAELGFEDRDLLYG